MTDDEILYNVLVKLDLTNRGFCSLQELIFDFYKIKYNKSYYDDYVSIKKHNEIFYFISNSLSIGSSTLATVCFIDSLSIKQHLRKYKINQFLYD